jgi:hypothetical protein
MGVDQMDATMVKNLEKKTGKTLKEWKKITRSSGIEKHREMIKYLQNEHRMTYGYANLVTRYARQDDRAKKPTSDELVEKQYSEKEDIRPFYEKLVKAVKKFGNDVEISPKKSYVSLRRSKQFAIIQPSTKTRLDVGLIFKGVEPTSRLEVAGSWNSMCSHRVRVTKKSEIDDELVNWLQDAYNTA